MERKLPRSVRERNLQLLSTGNLSDIKFIVGHPENQRTFAAHKILLASASEVFRAMFYGPLAETTNCITIPDAEPDGFEKMLRYIYLDDNNFDCPEIALSTLSLAHKYMMYHLQDICFVNALSSITPDTACQTLETARMFEMKRAKMISLYYICQHTDKIVMSEGFCNAHIETVEEIISQDYMNISEKQIIVSVLQWAYNECAKGRQKRTWKNIRKIITPLLPYFRFMTLTMEEFVSIPLDKKLLTESETLAVIMNIARPGLKPLPGWCSQKGKRVALPKWQQCSVPDTCLLSRQLDKAPAVITCRFTVISDCVVIHGVHYKAPCSLKSLNFTEHCNGILTFYNEKDNSIMRWTLPMKRYAGHTEFDVVLPVRVVVFEGETCEISLRLTDEENSKSRASSQESESAEKKEPFSFHRFRGFSSEGIDYFQTVFFNFYPQR